MGLRIVPLTLKEANEIVGRLHRHHKPVIGHRFSIGVELGGALVGAAICGRPVARKCDQRFTLEVTRLVTDGTKNACSILYAAAARAALAMGFHKIQTYLLAEEVQISVEAAGWEPEAITAGGDWNHGERKGRRTDQPMGQKIRWVKYLVH